MILTGIEDNLHYGIFILVGILSFVVAFLVRPAFDKHYRSFQIEKIADYTYFIAGFLMLIGLFGYLYYSKNIDQQFYEAFSFLITMYIGFFLLVFQAFLKA
ncbi:hypothetical protein [Methanobacterium formicicum]|uniref:Uncharacterized protein n=1 Tax=Methanobacterium formicicum (strain DSM 3637 / PP1) TaxID=1204725 RepID=K2R9H7_METFP|nr:hypothetical protein [Methanobacterium formicicum]EKF84979.1 hypothetical protein A994_11297 [Methanobacterium formicicum DSM 3637]